MSRAPLPVLLLLALLPALSAHAQASGTSTVRGRVEGPNGPLAGARVAAITAPESELLDSCDIPVEHQRGATSWSRPEKTYCPCVSAAKNLLARRFGETLAETTTDSGGSFELPPHSTAEPWLIFVESDELRALADPVEQEGFVIKAAPSATYQVRLVDADGTPLEGASFAPVPALPRMPLVRSGADGTATLELVSARRSAFLITKAGYAPLLLTNRGRPALSKNPANAVLPTVMLPRSTRLLGMVTFEGKPALGAKVSFFPANCGAEDVTTDLQGRFSLEAPTIPFIVLARGEELLAYTRALPPFRPVKVELAKGAFVEGTVTDSKGRPVPRALIALDRAGEHARTDARGHYRIGPLFPGHYEARIAELPVAGSAIAVSRKLDSGETLRADFKLAPTALLEGTVLDRLGTPVAGAMIDTSGPAGTPFQSCKVSTDYSGRFSCGERSHGRYDIRIWHPEITWLPTFVDLPLTKPLRISVEEGVAVSGTVLDAAGMPVPGARVALRGIHASALAFSFGGHVHDLDRSCRAMGVTDVQGRFALGRVRPGKYLLSAAWGDFGPETRALKPIEAAGNAIDVSLAPERDASNAGEPRGD